MYPSSARTESTKGNAPIIQPKLSLPFKHEMAGSAFSAVDPISSQETVPIFALSTREQKQDQGPSGNEIDDIANQATLPLPILKGISDQRQVIATTASSAAIAGMGDLTFAVFRYITNVVITNLVSVSIFGLYSIAYTSALIVGSIAVLGLDSTTVRFLSIYRARDEHNLAAGLIRFVLWMTLISGLLCGVLFYFSATVVAHVIYHKDAYALPLKEVTLLVPLISLQLVLGSGLQALKAIHWKVLVDRLIPPTLTLVLIVVFYLLGLRLDALILATICGFLASVITGQFLFRKASRRIVCDTVPGYEPKIWLRFALPMSFYVFIQIVMNSTDILFLTVFGTAAQVGLYSAADRASTFALMPLLALNTIFSPLIAEYYARGEHEQIASLFKVVTKWSFSLTLPVFLCFFVFHNAILSIFSKEYTSASIVLIILSFGYLANAAAGFAGGLLLMTGHPRVILANSAATIIANLGLAFFLVPRFNVIGAAVAATLALIILDVVYIIEAYWILKTHTFRLDMLKPVAAGGTASMVGLLLLRIIHVGFGYRAIFGALVLVILFMLVYVFVLSLLRFSKEDMMVFDAVLARIGKKKHT